MILLRALLVPLAVFLLALAVLTRWTFGFALAAAIFVRCCCVVDYR